MGKSVPHVASHHADFSALLWCLAVVMVGCLGWLFYTLYVALR
jgi:hypothetical protein